MTAAPNTFVKLYVDGGVLGRNPSPRGVYWSVVVEGVTPPVPPIRKQSTTLHTNGDSEWMAVWEALAWLVQARLQQPTVIYSDSRHVVDCFNGWKQIKVERHLRIAQACRRLARQLPFVTVVWAPRETLVAKVGH